ncbi:unnamed protein product, partial [Prorocentrum cordatum]
LRHWLRVARGRSALRSVPQEDRRVRPLGSLPDAGQRGERTELQWGLCRVPRSCGTSTSRRESQTVAMVCVALIVGTIMASQYANTLLVSWSRVGGFWGEMEEWGKSLAKGDGMSHLDEFQVQLLHFLFFALIHLLASAYQDRD